MAKKSSWGFDIHRKIRSKTVQIGIAFAFSLGAYLALALHHQPGAEASLWYLAAEHLARDIAISLAVAIVLIVTIEAVHRQHLDDSFQEKVEAIAESVFSGVFNADFPEEYVGRVMQDMFKARLIRSGMDVTYTLSEKVAAGFADTFPYLEVVADTSFTMKNISADPCEFRFGIGLPNPFLKELRSNVGLLEASYGGQKARNIADLNAELQFKLCSDKSMADVVIETVILQPGQELQFRLVYKMAKEEEDNEVLRTAYAADAISVTVFDKTTKGLLIHADGVKHGSVVNCSSTSVAPVHKWRTDGYVLPWQGVIFTWKRKPDMLMLKASGGDRSPEPLEACPATT